MTVVPTCQTNSPPNEFRPHKVWNQSDLTTGEFPSPGIM